MLSLAFSILPLLSAVPLLSTSALAQDVGQVGGQQVNFDLILDPPFDDGQSRWYNQMCTELQGGSEGLPFNHGVDTWSFFNLNNVLLQYLDSNPPTSDWTGQLYRDHLAIQPIANFRCQLDTDQCLIDAGCDTYRHKTGPWLAIAISNLHKISTAHIAAYDRVLQLLGANNQALAKSLFHTALGRDRSVFDVGSFFEGVLDGIELILEPTKVLSAFKGAIKFLAKEQLGPKLQALTAGPAPEQDASPFLASLSDTFRPLQNAERTVLARYMDTGVVDGVAASAHSDTVAFLQNGQLLNMPTFSSAGMVTDIAREMLKQTAAKIVAGIWNNQNVGISIRDQSACTTLASVSNTGPTGWFQITSDSEQGDFGSSKCLDIGRPRDIPEELPGILGSLGLNIGDIHRNAAKCALLGFPGLDSTNIDFGFPRCTFNLPRRDIV